MQRSKLRLMLATIGFLIFWSPGVALGGVRSAQITNTWPSLNMVQSLGTSKTSALIVLSGTYPTLNQASVVNNFKGITQLLITAGPPSGSTQVQAMDAVNGPILLISGSYLTSNNVFFLNQLARHSDVPLYIFVSSYPTASQAQVLRGLRKCIPYIVVTGAYPSTAEVFNLNGLPTGHLIINTSLMPRFIDVQNVNALRTATTVYISDASFASISQASLLGSINTKVNVYQGLAYSAQLLVVSVILQYETNN
jgi:hypothetical protein